MAVNNCLNNCASDWSDHPNNLGWVKATDGKCYIVYPGVQSNYATTPDLASCLSGNVDNNANAGALDAFGCTEPGCGFDKLETYVYTNPFTRPLNYLVLNKTWNIQKPYTL